MAFIIGACGSSKNLKPSTAEDYFAKAMEYYQDHDWLEANNYFEMLRLQYPASALADDAQFYIAEVHYKRGEYLLASFNYNVLRRSYPSSQYVKNALFNIGLCYYQMSPPFDRDQEYTTKTIQAFSEFQAVYPKDTMATRATKYIVEMRNKLAQRDYYTATIYRKLLNPLAANVYFDMVIDNYTDTEYYEKSFVEKIECLIEMRKTTEALSIIELYPKCFPKGKQQDYMRSLAEKARNLPDGKR